MKNEIHQTEDNKIENNVEKRGKEQPAEGNDKKHIPEDAKEGNEFEEKKDEEKIKDQDNKDNNLHGGVNDKENNEIKEEKKEEKEKPTQQDNKDNDNNSPAGANGNENNENKEKKEGEEIPANKDNNLDANFKEVNPPFEANNNIEVNLKDIKKQDENLIGKKGGENIFNKLLHSRYIYRLLYIPSCYGITKLLGCAIYSYINSFYNFEEIKLNKWYKNWYFLCFGYRWQPNIMKSYDWFLDMNINIAGSVAVSLLVWIFNKELKETFFSLFTELPNANLNVKIFNFYIAINIISIIKIVASVIWNTYKEKGKNILPINIINEPEKNELINNIINKPIKNEIKKDPNINNINVDDLEEEVNDLKKNLDKMSMLKNKGKQYNEYLEKNNKIPNDINAYRYVNLPPIKK